MITLKLNFLSNGVDIKRVAIISDDFSSLSESKKNQAVDIVDYSEDGFWSLCFEDDSESLRYYEVEFEYNRHDGFTLIPIKAITWLNDVIVDEQRVFLKIK